MNKNLKVFSTAVVLVITLVALAAVVSADSDLYSVSSVEVNGITVATGVVTNVQLDETTEVEVFIEGTGNATTCPSGNVDDCAVDARVRVWIGGYEYDDVEAVTSTFTVEPGVSYRKTLSLDIPADLDVEDHSYTIYVEVFDDEDSERGDYDIWAERPRHSLYLIDTIFDASVDAGAATSVEVRLENLGESKEEDIKVEAVLDTAVATMYLDELAAFEEDNEDEESSESIFLTLYTDEDMKSGYYDLLVTVTYNRGHDTLEQSYKVWVDGVDEESEDAGEAKTAISLSSTSVEGTEEEPTEIVLTFTNTGTGAGSYTVTVNGIAQWADASVSPSTVLVGAGASQEMTVTVTPDNDAEGDQDFSLQVLNEDGKLVQDIAMTMEVENGSWFGDSGSWLKIAFIILIVLIIIIGLIVAFRKLKDDDDDDEPLEPQEGKTYY